MSPTVVVKIRKLLSANKAVAAALTTLVGSAGAAAASYISSGVFDATEARVAAGGLVLAVLTGVVTWLTSAGTAEVETTDPQLYDRPYSKG